MIPDKIYVNPVSLEGYFNENHPDDCKEYVSKDALLEWLESMVYQHNEDRFDDGFNTAIGQVIDKINSL